MALGDDVENSAAVKKSNERFANAGSFLLRQAANRPDIHKQLHLRVEFVDILAARTGAARRFESNAFLGNENAVLDEHVGHVQHPRVKRSNNEGLFEEAE